MSFPCAHGRVVHLGVSDFPQIEERSDIVSTGVCRCSVHSFHPVLLSQLSWIQELQDDWSILWRSEAKSSTKSYVIVVV